MIPKKLHYVWVGGAPLPQKVVDCIESWKRVCPDYEIVKWDEHNFDMNRSPLLKLAYEQKRWALIADVIRIFVLYDNGGIYMDTDVEVLKPFDDFLDNKFFLGYEFKNSTGTAVIGSVKGHPILKRICDLYGSTQSLEIAKTILIDVQLPLAVARELYNIKINGKTAIYPTGIAMYSPKWFYPKRASTTRITVKPYTHTIHHYTASWVSAKKMKLFRIVLPILKLRILSPLLSLGERIGARKIRKKAVKLLKKYDKAVKTAK